MIVLSLIKHQLPADILSDISDKISDGADGEVFALKSDPNKLIKLSIIYDQDLNDSPQNLIDKYESIRLIHDEIIKNNYDHLCKVYYFSDYFVGSRSTVEGQQYFISYFSIIERLNKTSSDETKVFHSILSHEDQNKNKSYTDDKLKDILTGLSFGLDFNYDNVVGFYNKIKFCKIKHLDVHPRNIMKSGDGNFKLIDFDRMEIKQ
jgi:thiamine kinase-like enzyme